MMSIQHRHRSHYVHTIKRRVLGIWYNGADTSCVVADAAEIQNLHDGAMTAEAWIESDGWGENYEGRIFDKTDSAAEGWNLFLDSTNGLEATVYAATTPALSICGVDEFVFDGRKYLVTMQFDDGNARNVYLWLSGIPVASYATQDAAVDAVVADAGNDLYFGNRSDGVRTLDGSFGGWARISKVARYTPGVAFAPREPWNPPVVDANTSWQTNYGDGSGATLSDVAAGGNHGSLSNHKWVKV